MAKFPFDDASIRGLPAPAKGIRIDYDTGNVRGFAVQTSYTGTKKFRVVYVAKLADAVYVLHCFQKKTQQTAKRDIELAQKRLKALMKEIAP